MHKLYDSVDPDRNHSSPSVGSQNEQYSPSSHNSGQRRDFMTQNTSSGSTPKFHENTIRSHNNKTISVPGSSYPTLSSHSYQDSIPGHFSINASTPLDSRPTNVNGPRQSRSTMPQNGPIPTSIPLTRQKTPTSTPPHRSYRQKGLYPSSAYPDKRPSNGQKSHTYRPDGAPVHKSTHHQYPVQNPVMSYQAKDGQRYRQNLPSSLWDRQPQPQPQPWAFTRSRPIPNQYHRISVYLICRWRQYA
jgi:hypothetical protein